LFDLDFTTIAPIAAQPKSAGGSSSKADILSLFAAAPPPVPQVLPHHSTFPTQQEPQGSRQSNDYSSAFGGLNLGPTVPTPQSQPIQSQFPTNSSANNPWVATNQSPPQKPVNQFASPATRQPASNNNFSSGLFDNSQDVWGSPASNVAGPTTGNDPFAGFGNMQSGSSGYGSSKGNSGFDNIWK